MSIPAAQDNTPIENRDQLLRHCESGVKPKSGLLIGTEHEKFTLDAKTLKPAPYDGNNGVRALLEGMTRFGFKPIMEGENVVALERGRENITLEPAGQFELSGAPLTNLHQTAAELEKHYREVKEVAAGLGLMFLPLGYHPEAKVEDMPWMPKGRYKIMREYMPKVGKRGLEMMVLTCTTQVNLDYTSESDMARKMRAGLCISPIVSALFANAPFYHGKPNGLATNRCAVWLDVDKARSGIPAIALEKNFGFERYVDYALDVPMYFVLRNGKYIDCAGQSFRDFLNGKLPAFPGEKPVMADWLNHLTTLFPDVRLKTYLEMRSADVGNPAMIMALPAFWVGLFYDDTALNALEALTRGWSHADVNRLRSEVPEKGFAATMAGKTALDWARELVRLSSEGLARRAVKENGADETHYLDPLKVIVDSGKTQSTRLTELYQWSWKDDVTCVYAAQKL